MTEYAKTFGEELCNLDLSKVSCGEICNNKYMKYVGYPQSDDHQHAWLFEPSTLKMISQKITELLQGVESTGRDIVVTERVICNVLSTLTINQNPLNIGDIYTVDIIPTPEGRKDLQAYTNMTIALIVNAIKNEYGITECNKKLSIWTTILGDFNKHGLRSHSPIKLRKKTPQRMMFNMNY